MDVRLNTRSVKLWAALLGLAVVASSTVGCAATRRNRSRDRAKVLEAENINMRQRMTTMDGQIRQAHAEQDAAMARAQNLEGQLGTAQSQAQAAEFQAQQSAQQAAQMRQELAGVQNEIMATRQGLTQLNNRYVGLIDRHKAALAAAKSRPPAPIVTHERPIQGAPSLQAEALRRDLENKLRGYGVRELGVEVRNDGGQERVAIVLPDSFPAGKATLAHNKAAVKAVVGLASLIRKDYSGSEVVVEGHTDSDPIRRSNWASNEALSEARAQAVRDLLSRAGVGSISTRGYGAARPLDPGASKAAKSRNRRVEIFISPRG